MVAQLRKVQSRKAAEEKERRNKPPTEEDDEPKAFVVTMPEPYNPPEENKKASQDDQDEQEEQESGYSDQISRYLNDLIENPINENSSKRPAKEIRHYAVSDMRTANNSKVTNYVTTTPKIPKIEVLEDKKFAVKPNRSPPASIKNTISELGYLEDFINLKDNL